MKQEGVSWNQSLNNKRGVLTQFVCNVCGRKYKMEWARNNHQKLCKDFNKNEM